MKPTKKQINKLKKRVCRRAFGFESCKKCHDYKTENCEGKMNFKVYFAEPIIIEWEKIRSEK